GAVEGLNDATPFTAQGGNTAATSGGARLQAVQFAASLVGNLLNSPVPIRIGVRFDSLGGSATSALLGHGGPVTLYHDFPGAPRPSTWYPVALANKLAGTDLDNGIGNDIELVLNSDVDGPVVLGAHRFYYGFDGAVPAGDVSLVTVAVHEILHGLGFNTSLDLSTGAKLDGLDDIFEVHLERTGASPPDFPSMTDAQRLAAFTAAPEIHWVGANVAAASSLLTAGTAAGGRVEMYAPGPGISPDAVTHFNSDLAPFQVMENTYGGIQLDLRLARAVLADLGWGAEPDCVTIQVGGSGGAP
ncbi:MAG TPA: hypothetical protein VFR03_00025, partial [Thermoanaerobaculia bacterium]|nr:hypothetical protein [Thermoanaerobaculia bacterium]